MLLKCNYGDPVHIKLNQELLYYEQDSWSYENDINNFQRLIRAADPGLNDRTPSTLVKWPINRPASSAVNKMYHHLIIINFKN